jgi:hypothetical protein
MEILLARKSETEFPTATNDEANEQLIMDPMVPEFTNTTGNNSMYTDPISSDTSPSGMHNGSTVLVDNTNMNWINNRWRPAMGWLYMVTCMTDFIIFPVLWSLLQVMDKGVVTNQWEPITLKGAGLYHIAMGTVLGIAAYGRTKEKLEGKS